MFLVGDSQPTGVLLAEASRHQLGWGLCLLSTRVSGGWGQVLVTMRPAGRDAGKAGQEVRGRWVRREGADLVQVDAFPK